MRRSVPMLALVIVVLTLTFSIADAAECTIPNSFTAGTKAVAAQVNANFSAVKIAVDDNDSRIAALEAAIAALQTTMTTLQETMTTMQTDLDDLEAENIDLKARLAAVEVDTVAGLGEKLTIGTDINGYDVALFEGVNLQIVSVSGDSQGPANGTGNLIVGYNELRGTGDDRTGSHNIVVGTGQNYSSCCGLVAGANNTIGGLFSTVVGGSVNTASGTWGSSVSGGTANTASGTSSSVSGGDGNTASGFASSIVGGRNNKALANRVTVIGWENIAGTQAENSIYPYPWGVVWTRP